MIKTLDGITHIQHRAEMYIGNTEYSTALFKEVFDNGKDEILADRCKRIDVFLIKDDKGNIWNVVRDWSNGIPLTSPDLPGKDVPVEICTTINTGGKFDKTEDSSDYVIAAGQNGQGLKAVNALSSYLFITTKAHDKDNNYWRYSFENGKFIKKQLVKLKTNDDPYGTEIRFLPNKQYFQHPYPDKDIIMNDLLTSKYALGDNITINYNGAPIQNTYYDNFISNTIQNINAEGILKETKESCKIDIALCENLNEGKVFQGIVNLLSCNEGTHQNICFNLIKNKLFEIAEKNKKHVQLNDLLIPIKVLCNVKLRDPRFESQTKVKLAVRNNKLQPLIEPVIDKLIKNNKDFFNSVIDLAESYRINLQSSKESKKSKIGKTVVVTGLRDCSSRNREERSLYIVEGNSAAGGCISARTDGLAKYCAILGLRGKILNVLTATKQKILENDVIKSITAALGYKMFGEIDPLKCRYSKIFIMSDGDADGRHIDCLLTFVFYSLFPELIKEGMVYTILCPLYGCSIKKQFIPIFTDKERQEYNQQGIITRRFKGLGANLLRL